MAWLSTHDNEKSHTARMGRAKAGVICSGVWTHVTRPIETANSKAKLPCVTVCIISKANNSIRWPTWFTFYLIIINSRYRFQCRTLNCELSYFC